MGHTLKTPPSPRSGKPAPDHPKSLLLGADIDSTECNPKLVVSRMVVRNQHESLKEEHDLKKVTRNSRAKRSRRGEDEGRNRKPSSTHHETKSGRPTLLGEILDFPAKLVVCQLYRTLPEGLVCKGS